MNQQSKLLNSQVFWQECEDGTWILYEGEEELFRANNEDGMTAIMDFAKSKNYHYFISLHSDIDVISVDGIKLRRTTAPRRFDWEEIE